MNTEEKDTLQFVLQEMLQDQATLIKVNADLVTSINALNGTVNELREKIEKPKPVIVAADTKPIQEIIDKGLAGIQAIVGSKPQPVVKKYQILLFPERDAKLFYKIVFGRWFLFLVLMLLIDNLYNFSVHWSDNRKEVQQIELKNDRVNKAWDYLYERVGKAGKKEMDSAYSKSAESN